MSGPNVRDPDTNVLTPDKIYRYFKRKRDIETSTPLNKRRETPAIEDQDESPICHMEQLIG